MAHNNAGYFRNITTCVLVENFSQCEEKGVFGFTIVILGGYYILQLIYGTDKLK